LHLSRRRRRRMRNKRCPLTNGTATHELTIVYDASHRCYAEDKLSKKKHFGHIWRPQSCKFSRWSAWDIYPGQKYMLI